MKSKIGLAALTLVIVLVCLFLIAARGRGEATTLVLQTADTENLDDGIVDQTIPSTERGGYNQLSIGAPLNNQEWQSYVKWSLAAVPPDATIVSATLELNWAGE